MKNNCKICGSTEQNKILNLCENMKIMGKDFPESPSIIVECPKCGLVYVEMEAKQEDFNLYYSSPSSNPLSYYELYKKENVLEYFNDILNSFKQYITADSKILDSGGGCGEFAKFLIDKGYNNAEILDISPKCIEKSKEIGVNGILANCCEANKELENKYDLIIMCHSLEHFMDIDKVILEAKKMLKENGYLYIELPDAEKYSDTGAVPFTMFTYEHLYHFTLDTMDNIANAFGIKMVEKRAFKKADSYDVLYGLYQNNGKKKEVKYTDKTKKMILKYQEHSKNKLKPYIDEFEKTQEKLILWGVGASTALLLNETFDNCNVIQLIDRNQQRQGLKYKIKDKVFVVEEPSIINDDDATILILPYWYHLSIMKQIQEMGFKNTIKSFQNKDN